MNTNAIKTKVNRIGLVGQIVSIILIILMAVSCAGLLLSGIVMAVLPKDAVTIGVTTYMDVTVGRSLFDRYYDDLSEDVLSEINGTMRVNGSEFSDFAAEKTEDGLQFTAQTDRIEFKMQRFVYIMFAGLVYCAAALVVFVFLKRLSDAFRRCDTPFADEVIKRMSVFAWVLLGCAVVASGAEGIANALMVRTVDLEFSLNPGSFTDGLHTSISFAPILVALIVLFLTMIFRYGAELQKEADETL